MPGKLLDGAMDACVAMDQVGRIVYWNAAATRDWEWTAEEVAGKRLADLVFADPERHYEILAALGSSGQWHGFLATVTKRGGAREVHATACSVSLPPGERSTILLSFRAGKVPAVEAGLPGRLQRLEEFARNIDHTAHDLNNAISPFSMSMGLLQLRLQDPADASLLALLEAATEQAAAAVEELLQASRQACGRVSSE